MRKRVFVRVAAAAIAALVAIGVTDAFAQVRASQIGASIRDLSAEEVTTAKLPQAGGALVQAVREDSPADRAGLRSGDIVVEFDGERVRSASHLTRLVRETAPERTVASSVLRDGARTTVNITPEEGDRLSMVLPELGPRIEQRLRRLPRDFSFRLPPDIDPTPGLRRGAPRARLGLAVAPLTDQLASYFGVKEGALVSAVVEGSAAAQAGIQAGDVIVSIDGRSVRGAQDVVRASRDARPGAALDVRLFRNKQEMTVTVTIPELGAEPQDVLPV